MSVLQPIKRFFRRLGYLLLATPWAVVLGLIEILRSERGRRLLASLSLLGLLAALGLSHPVRSIAPGEVGVRWNRITGSMTEVREGWTLLLPGLHELHRYSLRDQVYRPARSSRAAGEAPYQSIEGLSLGVEVAVRYALDAAHIPAVARKLPTDVGAQLVEPVVDGVLHRTFAKHTVREIFSSHRGEIQQALAAELGALLLPDGVIVKAVFLGNVDLPSEYKNGLEALLSEELHTEKMRYTLELKEKKVKESELDGEAQKVQREKAAEAAGREEIIAAKAKAEAMQHILPFKEREIEQKRLEAEAQKVQRLKHAEGEAEARRIESSGEADARRKLADSDAYRTEVLGKASSEQLARESALIAKNPLLIQKTLADKLSDKIQVIIAPPTAGGFFAGSLLGQAKASEPAHKQSSAEEE